jgi:hypothetical protein
MYTLFLLVCLTGAVLGMRLKVLILAPAIGATVIAVFAAGIARGEDIPAILLAGLLALICLQIGYLGGVLIRYTMTPARARSRRQAPLQTESPR